MRSLPFLLMACLTLLFMTGEADAAASPVSVSITTNQYTYDILEGEMAVTILTLENSDAEFRKQEAYLAVNLPSGTAWPFEFVDTNYDVIPNNEVRLTKGGTATLFLIVYCYDECSAGDTNVFQIYAKTDPRFYDNGGNNTDTCGSDDCETDTTPANKSTNVTNTIAINFIARTGFTSSLSCDAVSSAGGNEVASDNTTLWAYTLTNTGWNSDNYQFTSVVTSADGHNVDYWTVNPGMADGKELTGQSNTSSTAVHTAESSISIIPATNATPGIYNVELAVTSNNGAPDSGCNFDVIVPGSEVEEETTGDPANETAEKETEEVIETLPEEEIEELPEEVSAISLIPVLISIGLIAVSRRK